MMHEPWSKERADLHHLYQQIEIIRKERDAAYQLLDRLPVLIYHYDLVEQRSLYRNREVLAMLGYSAEEMQEIGGNILAMLMHPDDYARYQMYMAALLQMETGEVTEFEYRMRHKDTSWRWILSRDVVVARTADGTPQQIIGTAHDITERKQVEAEREHMAAALRASEENYRHVFENSIDAIAIVQDGLIQYCNARLAEMVARPIDQMLGESFEPIVHPDDRELTRSRYIQRMQGEAVPTFYEIALLHRDGQRLPVEMSIGTMDYAGRPATLVFIRDITERKQAEAEQQQLQQQIIDAQQAAIHELSSPLLPIADRILALPLIGTIDSARAQQVMETLLEGIATHRTRVVIIDITGVRVVDTQVAQALVQTARAVQLLGARVILTGIQPQIAQTLVQLGADLRGMVTRNTLQAGIAEALHTAQTNHRRGSKV